MCKSTSQTVSRISLFLSGMVLLSFSNSIFAHERWIMSEEQIAEWNALPKPELFTQLSGHNFVLITVFLFFIVGWVWLGFTGARELFPDLQARLGSYGEHVPRILRVCLAWILLSSAFGVEPRFGIDPFTTPTLFAPDLYLNKLGPSWNWLQWTEVILALAILFGIYVRFFATLLIFLSLWGFYWYGEAILAYAGALIGASIYLVLQGAGRHYFPLPTPAFLQDLQNWLASQPRQRAQAIMRILTGTTMLYLGVVFKLLQPNLAIGIITIYKVPILSLAPITFALIMTLVEISAGILMIAGVLLRPLSLFLMAAFSFFALLLPETITAHILFYGVMLSCLINSAGHLHLPVARDKAAQIVIIGGGLSALHAAIKIEKIIGQYSNVKINLLHEQSNFLFVPFLPEVLGGTVQAGNVVNPYRRILRHTKVIVGRLESIDDKQQIVIAKRKNGDRLELNYDSLIVATSPKSTVSDIQGMGTYGYPLDSVADILHTRQRVLELVEEAEFCYDVAEKKRLLTFAIVGATELAAAIAVEICAMLRSAEPSYPGLRESSWRVYLYQNTDKLDSDFEQQINSVRNQCLQNAGVLVDATAKITKVEQEQILLSDGQSLAVGLVVNAVFIFSDLVFSSAETLSYPLEVTENLNLKNHQQIWIPQPSTDKKAQFLFSGDLCALGSSAGYNAWAATQGYVPQVFQPPKHLFKTYNMGTYSLCYIGNICITGLAAWFVSRLINLLSVPGLERNLRILIDWWLVIPFRTDIAVLGQTVSNKLQKTQFKAGEEIYRQGDVAESAYAVETGCLEIIQNGRKVREIGAGDYFGEISPLDNGRRPETVRCLSACELTLISQEDLATLARGNRLIDKAMRNLTEYRHSNSEARGLKRITYVSKLNAPLTETDIIAIGEQASQNNKKIDVTGILISVHGYFFQILEGDPAIADNLLEKIRLDPRHTDLTILSAEYDCEERYFSDWNMKTVTLTQSKDHLLQAISVMLENIAQSHSIIGHYAHPIIFKQLTQGVNPLTLPVASQERIVIAATGIDFAQSPEGVSDKELVKTINAYLDIFTTVVTKYGGQFAKYSDSAMLADFLITQANSAIAACIEISNNIQALKNSSLSNLVECHFGIFSGIIIESNIGSSLKMDYLILGGPVEKANQLAQLAKSKQVLIVLSEQVKKIADDSWCFEYAEELQLTNANDTTKLYILG